MGVFSRFRRRRRPFEAKTDEERIARYIYLLNTLPAGVIEGAHTAAFRDIPADRRREMFESLRPFMAESERDASPGDPTVLARLVRRAEERRAARGGADRPGATMTYADVADGRGEPDPRDLMMQTGVMAIVANQFLVSAAVSVYFTQGAGSLMIADQPTWVGETFDPGGYAGGDAGYAGGGWDGGGFGGGFDGGGFGGGDGGGGG